MRLLPLLLIATAHVPLLIVYFQQLWARPHYQFFPLVLGVFAYFVWKRRDERHEVSTRDYLLSQILVLLALPLLTYSFLRLSPMFAYVSFVLVLGSILLRLGIPALGPWLLLWMVVRIPYGQDVALIQWMQRFTTQLSSTALDSIGIEHIADGNVLMFPTTSLFVEEACSGVVSLLAIVACAGILAVWWHRAIVHSLILLAAAVVLAGAMNVVRVVTIAVALDSFGIDLTEGWRHEALGLVIFAVSLLALFSIDRILFFLFSPIPMNPLADYFDDAEGNVLVGFWNRFVGLEPPESDYGDAFQDDDAELAVRRPLPRRIGFLAGMSWDWTLAAVFLILCGGQVLAGIGPFSVAREVSPSALSLREESLPSTWNRWRLVGFEEIERDSSSVFGERSRIWAFHNGQTTVRISLDFVFPEWHALTACYKGVGWTLESIDKHKSMGAAAYEEGTFTKPDGDWALLLYDLFDEEGRPYEVPTGSFVHPTLRRILSGQSSRWSLPNYYQVQALSVSEVGPLSVQEVEETRELFQWFRNRMIEIVAATPHAGDEAPIDNTSENPASSRDAHLPARADLDHATPRTE